MVAYTFNPETEASKSQSLRLAWSRMARVAQRKAVLENKQPLPQTNKQTNKVERKNPLSLIVSASLSVLTRFFPFSETEVYQHIPV